MKTPKSFEIGIERLDEILTLLNNADIPLAESVKLYAEAAQLVAFCEKSLAEAKLQIEEIDAKMNQVEEALDA